nr:hypothetical protein [uncultured Pseudomonas sp.]
MPLFKPFFFQVEKSQGAGFHENDLTSEYGRDKKFHVFRVPSKENHGRLRSQKYSSGRFWIRRSKIMISDSRLMEALYFLVSILGFWCLRSISRRISGQNFTHGKYWAFFALSLFWGANQLSVADYGRLFLFMPTLEVFESDYIIRWIALISAVAQAFILPVKKEQNRWFSRN